MVVATVPSRKQQVGFSSSAEDSPPLKIVVAYESFESGLHAAQVYQHLVEMLDHDYAFEVDFWRFEVLKVPSIGEVGANKAAQADLILIAVEGNSMLPVDFQLWVEKWIEKKVGQDSALVLVARPTKESAPATVSLLAYLRGVAARGAMTFISDSVTVLSRTEVEYRSEQAVRTLPSGAEALLGSPAPGPQ